MLTFPLLPNLPQTLWVIEKGILQGPKWQTNEFLISFYFPRLHTRIKAASGNMFDYLFTLSYYQCL